MPHLSDCCHNDEEILEMERTGTERHLISSVIRGTAFSSDGETEGRCSSTEFEGMQAGLKLGFDISLNLCFIFSKTEGNDIYKVSVAVK